MEGIERENKRRKEREKEKQKGKSNDLLDKNIVKGLNYFEHVKVSFHVKENRA